MPTYHILIRRDLRQEATLDIVADDPNAAYAIAEQSINRDGTIEWMDNFNDDFIEVWEADSVSSHSLVSGWAKDPQLPE